MALVEFVDNSPPYINANNLNNNFTECNNIVESGSNTNGNWIKYSDGTMICWNRVVVTDQTISNAYGSLYQGVRAFTFPQTFISAPTGLCNEFKYGNGASWGTINGTTTTDIACRGFDIVSRATGTNCYIGWMAIGKWK